jgi:ATP-dependent protease ClpP protease subunit
MMDRLDVPDVPGADFTPNSDRAIWIEGKFTAAMLDRLRPRILELTAENREPITVFVNGSGGSPDVAEAILNLLRRTTRDDPRRSRIITVAYSQALSMAANFLSAGDLAIAHPCCTLLWHGGRWPLTDLVSAGEAGAAYARTLPVYHEINAAKLALYCERRFLRIVSAYRETFGQVRANAGDPTVTELQCLQGLLRGKLSPAGQKVLDRAIPLWDSYNGLLLEFEKRLRRRRGRTVSKAHLRKLMVYSAFDFEYDKGDPVKWDAGLAPISDHFYFLNCYFDDVGKLRAWVAARPEPQTAAKDADADLQFRLFFLALCRALQEGENFITAADAVWLGLIDTVREEPPAVRASS